MPCSFYQSEDRERCERCLERETCEYLPQQLEHDADNNQQEELSERD